MSDQSSYENLLKVTADTLVTLEALRKEIQRIMSDMADIETMIYGNSKDVHDNYSEAIDTT